MEIRTYVDDCRQEYILLLQKKREELLLVLEELDMEIEHISQFKKPEEEDSENAPSRMFIQNDSVPNNASISEEEITALSHKMTGTKILLWALNRLSEPASISEISVEVGKLSDYFDEIQSRIQNKTLAGWLNVSAVALCKSNVIVKHKSEERRGGVIFSLAMAA